MTRNGIMLTVVAVILAAIYVFFFTDWFKTHTIQIIPVIRPDRASRIPRADEQAVYPVAFKLDGTYRLTEVKVMQADDFATNKFAVPLWHMVADEASIPVDAIIYGGRIKGMKPKIPRSRPEALNPDVAYVLYLAAGSTIGRTNFYTKTVIKR